ncbi:MAG: ABC transporter permease [Acidobacteriaceae bacterium]
MQTLLQDVRLSLRQLRQSLGFTCTAILTLALGIGSVTSVFSVVDSILLKPFAFPHPERLVVLRETLQELGNGAPLPDNYKHYLNWQAQSKTLQAAAILRPDSFSVGAGSDHPQIVHGLLVSPDFFSVLGAGPDRGRSFRPEEAVSGHGHELILTWAAWQRYFHGDADAVGRTLRVGGEPYTVVGILPRSFRVPHFEVMPSAGSPGQAQPYEIFAPFVPSPNQMGDIGDFDFVVLARLKPNVTVAQAQSELAGLQQAFMGAAHLPEHLGIVVEPLSQEVTGSVSTGLWLLLAAVGAVLLIACVNLANLQLARAVAREREMAVRAALGASQGRLLQSALMESLLLALFGGLLGILLSFAGVWAFVAAAPAGLPRLHEVHVSWAVLLFAAALSIVTALLFGTLPALRSMRVDPHAAMQTNLNRMSASREGGRTRSLLVAAEVACTVILLIVTGLVVRSFEHLLSQQRAFDADHVVLTEVDLDNPAYGDTRPDSQTRKAAFIDRALDGLARIPGVSSAAMTSEMPMAGETWVNSIHRPDHPLPPWHTPTANMRWVSPEYASTLRIPLLKGRMLQPSDKEHPDRVLISEQMARAGWPGEDPVGRTFKSGDTPLTVVGVVADARINNLKRTANMVYVPYWQQAPWTVFFLVRSSYPTATLADSIRRTIWSIDPQVPIPLLKSMDDQVDESVATDRFQTLLLSSFGAAALLLATLGVYGVLAYSVSLRRHEFGIRLALGSGKTALMRVVLGQAAYPVVGGLVAGLVAAFIATRWIESLLYQTQLADPLTLFASIALLLTAALLAAVLPARRAAAVDPMQVLREE